MKKRILVSLPFLFLLLGFTGAKLVDDKLKNLLQQFKMSEETAKSSILSNISGPSFYIPNVKVLKDLAAGERAAMVEAIGNNVKEYVSSKEFLQKYNEMREYRKPAPPEKPKTAAELKEEYRTNITNSIAEFKNSKKQAPADQQNMFEEMIKTMEQQLKDLDDPNNTMFSPQMDVYSQQGYEMQMDQYKKELAEWEIEYPLNNPNPLVKKWINAFLEKTNNIDFNAQLKTEKGKQIFVNPEYERKDYQWKLYFRAGKQSVDAARKFAQSWLSELK